MSKLLNIRQGGSMSKISKAVSVNSPGIVLNQAKESIGKTVIKDLNRNKYIYCMLVPVMLYYTIFHYVPLYGIQIAFKDFSIYKGIGAGKWVGFEYFKTFFSGIYFGRVIVNTLMINILELIFAFPAPIILAILLNEIKNDAFKRCVQTVTYIPHFISIVVIVGIMTDFLSRDGLINKIMEMFNISAIPFMQEAGWFRTLFIGSGIWQQVGWKSIIYIAAIIGIDPSLYEAAIVDGAGRFRRIWNITIPCIMPTIIILLILQMGSMMSVGFEKIILMYNPSTYSTADVISSYVFRQGLQNSDYSYAAAVGLFNSVINFALLVISNTISRRVNETSLW
jgi:putative aldouronate transport system permease protein